MAKRKSSESSLDDARSKKARLDLVDSLEPYVDLGKKKPKKRPDIIKTANSLAFEDFSHQYAGEPLHALEQSHRDLSFHLKPVAALEGQQLDACLGLIEYTSRQDYEKSSWGWHPARKKREMREKELRYLLVYSSSPEENPRDSPPPTAENLIGFTSFMLTHDSVPAVPVVYIYEIHLLPAFRARGLGSHLMEFVERVGERVGVRKSMLTCFVSNGKAHDFYRRRGYVTDVCSPEARKVRGRVVEGDYVIMSKDMMPKAENEEE